MMRSNRAPSLFLPALLLGLAICASAWWVGDRYYQSRTVERSVTVKGLAERQVTADLALWPLQYVASGNNLDEVTATLKQDRQTVMNFLTSAGFQPSEIERQSLSVNDRQAQLWGQNDGGARYILSETLMLRTDKVELVKELSQQVSTLVDAGVILSTDRGPNANEPSYLFESLNTIKPEMIAEATASARASAEQFARDAESRIGGLKRANQGVFQIQARDNYPGAQATQQLHKNVRAVVTLEYYLRD